MSGSPAATARAQLLPHVQGLYDHHQFLDAYRLTKTLWTSTEVAELSVEELILGGRLALRLGGKRLSRYLLREAWRREPENPRVRYYGMRRRDTNIFDELRALEAKPDLGGSDPEIRASWFASWAYTWAVVRDFERAQEYLRRARELEVKDAWVLACESEVMGMADRWTDAARTAEQGWQINPGAPYAAKALASAWLNQGRVRESAMWASDAAEQTQSYEVVEIAVRQLCAWAESLEGPERQEVITRARQLAGRFQALTPLADRETKDGFARIWLDIAELADDHSEMEHWVEHVRSPFHRQMLANLRQNRTGRRIRLPFRRVVQRMDACLPTAMASALAANGIEVSADEIAAEITFGGTTEWAAVDWLKRRGLHTRQFAVNAELAKKLIGNGIAFVYSSDADEAGHSVAVVGLDEAAGTVLVHDPTSFRSTEYLLTWFDKKRGPAGFQCLTAVRPEKSEVLDALLPPEAAVIAAAHEHQRAVTTEGPTSGRRVVDEVVNRFPHHPGTRLIEAAQQLEEGHTGRALRGFQALLEEFPESPVLRVRVLAASRALGNTALLRETLKSIIDFGVLPGMQSRQDWDYPPPRYEYEYADLLRLSASTRPEAKRRLRNLLQRAVTCAGAWHVLADLLWLEQDREGGLLAYRVASCLAYSDEHYARAYADALWAEHREKEGLAWLEKRVRDFGTSGHAVSTWVTWIGVLEDWGHPERALTACREAIGLHKHSAELLGFAVPFLARMGMWAEAQEQLAHMRQQSPTRFLHAAAVQCYRMQGELGAARNAAEAWVAETPRDMAARYALLDVITTQEGARAAVLRAQEWVRGQPANEDLEEVYCQQIERAAAEVGKTLTVLRRRLRRNAEDAWAWRELTFACVNRVHELADNRRREKLRPKIEHLLTECARTAPEDAATLRAQALWMEAQGKWNEAVAGWKAAIEGEPGTTYSYRRLWECSARRPLDEQKDLWRWMERQLLSAPGRLPGARDMMALLVERFGPQEAERTIQTWIERRPEDPDVVEAAADLLIEHGHGRTDAERARVLLEPAVKRFPYHTGLRFSLMSAYRGTGMDDAAQQVLTEILRRHPDHVSAYLQQAAVQERAGNLAQAEELLDKARRVSPRDVTVWAARAELLIRTGRLGDAVKLIEQALEQMPESVGGRERAITLLIDCGEEERAVRTARHGVEIFPRGAYMWLLLGRTLNQQRQWARPGEIEECLRLSLKFNAELFEAADLLAMFLAEQRQYGEAEKVLRELENRMAYPNPVRGRLAWIRWQRGERTQAIEEMAQLVAQIPWYHWGWMVLMDWLEEGPIQSKVRELLREVPPQMFSNLRFRYRRLMLLERADLRREELDAEWEKLLRDFPEDQSLHLNRYDSLMASKRQDDAANVLERIRERYPQSAFVLARHAEVLMQQNKTDEAMAIALEVWFAPVEESTWPAVKVWEVMTGTKRETTMCAFARARLENGARPTPRAWALMVRQAVKTSGPTNLRFSVTPIPDGVKNVLTLLEAASRTPWEDGSYRAEAFATLVDGGYAEWVVKEWKARGKTESHVGAWAQIGRALVQAKQKEAARRWLATWRERTGVTVWMVANYLLCLSRQRREQLQELARTSAAALSDLPHDHCARYVAHLRAEAQALLGDRHGLLETWNEYNSYFNGFKREDEYFRTEDENLLAEIPMLVRFLQQDEQWLYRKTVWMLRWKHISGGGISQGAAVWWIAILAYLMLRVLLGQ